MSGGLLAEPYAGIMFDIDGVVRLGNEPVPGAAEAIAELERRGIAIAFVTNNAALTPSQMAASLRSVGIPAEPEQVMTSALAAAELLEPGTVCLIIGEEGLRNALRERGCTQTREPERAGAVVVGLDRDLRWDDLRRATLAIRRGARFVATNDDATFPSPEGLWPGNGAVVAALVTASGVAAEVAGKPQAPLLRAAAALLPPGPVLMVGDRYETDIVGAAALGMDTALVLTGVTSPAEAAALAPPPTFVLERLTDLLAPSPRLAPRP